MKKIISLVIIGLFFGYVVAYTPTSQDVTQIISLKNQLDSISSGNMKDKWDFYAQLKTLQEQFASHEQLNYYLDALGLYLITQVNTKKTEVKFNSKLQKQAFVEQLSGWFSQDITTADTCTGWYNTIDSISFANNFPTALTIATRYRELNCGYYMPANGDGPFQIISKDYGTWAITEAKFLSAIQDFIDFSKAKHLQYKTKLWISLTYTWFTWTGLVYHSALYNGGTITWNTVNGYIITPNKPHYVYDGYGQAYSGAARYGLLPKFLKILDWELKNTY